MEFFKENLSTNFDLIAVFYKVAFAIANSFISALRFTVINMPFVFFQMAQLVYLRLGGSGADPGFFLGGGALVSCSTSTPINHTVFFFLQNTSCIRKPQVISEGGGGRWCAPPAPSP